MVHDFDEPNRKAFSPQLILFEAGVDSSNELGDRLHLNNSESIWFPRFYKSYFMSLIDAIES